MICLFCEASFRPVSCGLVLWRGNVLLQQEFIQQGEPTIQGRGDPCILRLYGFGVQAGGFTRVFSEWESVGASGSADPPRAWPGQARLGRLSAAL